MTYYPFEINMESSLEEVCEKGFVSFSLVKESHGHPITVFLWHATGDGIKVQCVMHDLAARLEVGSLAISSVSANVDNLSTVKLLNDFQHSLSLDKLLFVDDAATVESGIVITSKIGNELLLVSGAFPYTVEIAAPNFDGGFEPEYPINEYDRECVA